MKIQEKLFNKITQLENPDLFISNLEDEINEQRQEIAKALIDLKNSGRIHYLVKNPDNLYITHIDGEEIKWKIIETKDEKNQTELFDREGNIFIDPFEFFNYIQSLPEPSKIENEKLFKELQELEGNTYNKKVLDIAIKNIKLIKQTTLPVVNYEDLNEEELREYYQYILKGLCRSIEKFDIEKGFQISTLAYRWILQGSTRARSKIIQKRMLKKYGQTISINRIATRSREIYEKTDKYPSYDEIFESFSDELERLQKIEDEKEKSKVEKYKKKIGINKLYINIFDVSENEYPPEQSKEQIKNAVNQLSEFESKIIKLRYGLDGDNNELGLTLNEIGEKFDLTRERIRQVESIAIDKIKFLISDKSPSQDIPLAYFTKDIIKFFKENNITIISDITSLTSDEIIQKFNISPKKLTNLLNSLSEMGFEIKKGEIAVGAIDFSKLSVRSTNALKKSGLSTIEELQTKDLRNIANLGEKSVKEILEYLDSHKSQKNSNQVNGETVLLFPCANISSQKNFTKTMESKTNVNDLKDYLYPNQYEDLLEIEDNFYFWGIKSTTDKGWAQISNNSIGIFFANKKAFAIGEIVYKLINPNLADYFWSPDEISNRSYKYMFAFKNLTYTDIDQIEINKLIGFKENYVVQGFMGLNKIRSENLKNYINNS